MTLVSLVRKIWRRLPLDGAGVLGQAPCHRVGARGFWKRVPAWARPAAIAAARLMWLAACPVKALAESRRDYAHACDVWISLWSGWTKGKTPRDSVLHRAMARGDRTRLRLAGEIPDSRQGVLVLHALGDAKDIALARDKLAMAEQLTRLRLSVPLTRGLLARGQPPDRIAGLWNSPGKLLVKPRHGSHAAGLLSVQPMPDGSYLAGGRISINRQELFQRLEFRARQDDLLVQSFIEPSGSTQDVSPEAPAVVRIFMMRSEPGGYVTPAAAMLKILPPGRDAPDSAAVDTLPVFPIRIETGKLEPGLLFEDPRNRVFRLPWCGTPLPGRTIPEWSQVVDMATQASGILPGTPVIGWDVLLGCDGPVLLEANTGVSLFRAMLWHFEHGIRSPLYDALEAWRRPPGLR